MLYAADKLGIEIPYTVPEMISFAYALVEKNNLKEAYIRPFVFMDKNQTLRSDTKANVMITCWKWARYFGHNDISVLVSSIRSLHPKTIFIDCKVSGHYVNAILATKEARSKGCDEALMLDLEGYVSQGPAFSFFYEKNGRLYTPESKNIFPGITRATVIDLAKQMGIDVIEKEFGVEDVIQADGAFFTGTAAEVTGIGAINQHKLRLPWEDTIGHLLHNRYKRIVSGKDATNFLEYF
jgi:branched-chain amino acid aminotransferase